MRITFSFVLLFVGHLAFGQGRLNVDTIIQNYTQVKADTEYESVSVGTVGNGVLKNGKLMPYKGVNFMYFDRDSYLEGRAFLHGDVRAAVLSSYDSLNRVLPNRYFGIMECSNETGGELFPHKTHQNGLSIDFMMPLIKDGKPFYGLDTLGAKHYTLNFDDKGRYTRDTKVEIDFNLVARHILLLDFYAKKVGMNVAKVIIKIELKEALFATPYGQILKESDIYVVNGLSPLINALHDDHFHIDFGFLTRKTNPTKHSETTRPSEN